MSIQHISTDKKTGRTTFLLGDTNYAIANALRRTILDHVPTMAIDEVEFHKNSSVLYDEIISHRLGLLVIATDLKSYTIKNECKCGGEGCARCTLKMTLKAKGPCIVYAKDIKSKDPKVKPVHPDTPIVKLLKGQELELETTAVLGRGADHVKWSPGHAWYKRKPLITIDHKKLKNAQETAASCPVDVYTAKDGKLAINKDNELACTLCMACVDTSQGAVQVQGSSTEFVFNVEPWGQLDVREIVTNALDALSGKLDELADFIAK